MHEKKISLKWKELPDKGEENRRTKLHKVCNKFREDFTKGKGGLWASIGCASRGS